MTEEQETTGPVIRDRRRIDPETGQVREPRGTAAPFTPPAMPSDGSPAGADGLAVGDGAGANVDVAAILAERTADLQRLQAEYVNYKRRVERDRELARQSTIGAVLSSLLAVLDDIARAREHGELSGGFKAVAESLERTLTNLGLTSFGEPGERFDPRIHEALMHSYSEEVEEPVCSAVLQVGYRHGDRILRPARVAVAEPSAPQGQEGDGDVDQHGSAAASDLSGAGTPVDRQAPDNSELADVAAESANAPDAPDTPTE